MTAPKPAAKKPAARKPAAKKPVAEPAPKFEPSGLDEFASVGDEGSNPPDAPAAVDTVEPVAGRPNLVDGARGQHVKDLEVLLHEQGFYDRAAPSGVYGTSLARAVRRAQGHFGLKPNGKTDQALWAHLEGAGK
jgi:peptidoglycan hydrolase-like protein with peptidoglycan-binding domain